MGFSYGWIAQGDQHKLSAKEWVAGISYFNFHFQSLIYKWVVEGGIKLIARSTKYITTAY